MGRAFGIAPAPRGPSEPSPRHAVSVFSYDEEPLTFSWTLDELLDAIDRNQPRGPDDPDWNFAVGEKPDYLVISTSGPGVFRGQHQIWAEDGKFEGAMLFDHLTLTDVSEILGRLYQGRRAEGCFAPYTGRFEFYRSDRDITRAPQPPPVETHRQHGAMG